MPVLEISHPATDPPPGALTRTCERAAQALGVDANKCWALWRCTPHAHAHRPDWREHAPCGPTVLITCRASHSSAAVRAMLAAIRGTLAEALACPPDSVFIAVRRAADDEILSITPS